MGAPVAVDPTLIDSNRRQVVAERALQWLEKQCAGQAASRVVIGVLSDDLYSAQRSWRFAFSIRKRRVGAPGLAVMSMARMNEAYYGHGPNDALLSDRFGKMLAMLAFFNDGISAKPLPNMARTPFRWMLRGAGYDLGIFIVSFLLPLGGPHFPMGPAVVLRYLNWPSWWRMHRLIEDPGGDASQLVLYSGAVLLDGAFYGLIAWVVARALGGGAPWAPPDDARG